MQQLISDNLYVLPPLILLLGIVGLWYSKSRGSGIYSPDSTTFGPPDNRPAIEVGALVKGRVTRRDVAILIVGLAIRGYINITYKYEYSFELVKPVSEVTTDPGLSEVERKLISSMFSKSQIAQPSHLAEAFYSSRSVLYGMVYDSLVRNGYFDRRPDTFRYVFQVPSAALGIIAAVMFILTCPGAPWQVSVEWAISIAICAIILGLGSLIVSSRTTKGKNALLAAKRFRDFLSGEQPQATAYQVQPGDFEKFLPYALVFGVSGKWGEAFRDVPSTPPTWYAVDGKYFPPHSLGYELDSAVGSWAAGMYTGASRYSFQSRWS